MDFFKDVADVTSKNKTSSHKAFYSYEKESMELGFDGTFFLDLMMRKNVTYALYSEHGRTVNQMLKTTIESFQ